VKFHGKPIMIVAVPFTPTNGRERPRPVEGDPDGAYRQTGAGKGLMVAENLAILEHLKLNDMLELQTPSGPLRLPIRGILRDYSNQLGAIFIDRSVYIRCYGDDSVDMFRVFVKPGVAAETVRREIVERAGAVHMFVLLNREVRDYILSVTSQWFGMTYLQLVVAVIVAVLGIVNTLTVSIADRRRELGVLRAVGGLRNQIRGTVWLEATAIGLIGLVLGIATGAINLYYELEAIRSDLTGLPLSYEFPFGVVAILVPVILLAAFGSAILPAESAVRSSLVEALEYE
jgi:putative ABC transport system permease protein